MQETDTCFSNLESPAAGANVGTGWQQLRGWLVPKRGFHFVDVRARLGSRTFPGVYGFPRADLAAHFEPTRRWLPAEYTIEIDLPTGPSEIGIEALSLAGDWQSLQTVSFRAEGDPAARAAHDPICAEEFALTLDVLLKTGHDADAAAKIARSIPYPPALRPNHLPFHGFIDEPAAISPALYGRLHVLGWLFHEKLPIKNAYVSTDLLVFQRLEQSGEFPGVTERFPQQPHARNCRVFGFADISSQLPAPVSVRVYAELADGSMHLALAVQSRAVATEELKAPYPPFSLRTFRAGWNKTESAFAERNIPFERGAKLRAQIWHRFGRYRREAPRALNSKPFSSGPAVVAVAPGKRRLLLLTHNLNLEGAPLLFVEYARHLTSQPDTELIVVSGLEGPLRAAFSALGAKVEIIDGANLLAARSASDLRRRLATIVSASKWPKLDTVVANTLFNFWGIELAALLGCPSLLYLHESTDPIGFFRERISPALLPAVAHALAEATAVSFNTPATRAYYQPYASGENFCLTSGWIDLTAIESYRATHDRTGMRQQLRLSPAELFVANIGTVCDRKGQHDFLRAIEWLWRAKPDLARRCRFALIGGRATPYNRFIEQTIADLARPNIVVVAETDRAYDYFLAADLFVCTSYEESFPRVVLEAMAFGVPIVSTAVHGIPYMLRDDAEALFVRPGEINGLALAIARALEAPEETKARVLKAQQRVREFDAATVLPRHAALTAAVMAAQA